MSRFVIMTGLAVGAVCGARSASPAQAFVGRSFAARVVAVTDGDTVRVLADGRPEMRIRLAEIDAPESGQPFGKASKREMSSIAFGRTVVVRPESIDRYGRTVAHLMAGSMDVGAEMVRRGAAWVFVQYSRDPALPGLQARAQRARLGLWALPPDQRVAPWEWRQQMRRQGHAILPAFPHLLLPFTPRPAPSGGMSCSAKRFCTQMSSCEEAIYHLRVCGQTRLDGDHDGKPCERLCG